jgi:hypothetical protein
MDLRLDENWVGKKVQQKIEEWEMHSVMLTADK